MPANAYRASDKQFVETVRQYTIEPFTHINRTIETRIADGAYDIIEEVDAIVECFRGLFPENNLGISIRIYTLPPKVMLECVTNHMLEIISYEKEMMMYGQPHEEIYLLEEYHFRILKHSLDILNRVCRRFIANNYQPTLTRHTSTPDVVMTREDYRRANSLFHIIVEHIERTYNYTYSATLTALDSEWPEIKAIIQQLDQYEFIQEPEPNFLCPRDEMSDENEDNYHDAEHPMEIEDEDAESTMDLGDCFT